MKVLHVTYTFHPDASGGTERYVDGLCRALAKRDIASCVAAPATKVGQETVTWSDGSEERITPLFVRLSAPANVIGLPAMAVPCGFTQAGLPVGFQVIGRPFDEVTVIRIGDAYQRMTDWHTRAPAL